MGFSLGSVGCGNCCGETPGCPRGCEPYPIPGVDLLLEWWTGSNAYPDPPDGSITLTFNGTDSWTGTATGLTNFACDPPEDVDLDFTLTCDVAAVNPFPFMTIDTVDCDGSPIVATDYGAGASYDPYSAFFADFGANIDGIATSFRISADRPETPSGCCADIAFGINSCFTLGVPDLSFTIELGGNTIASGTTDGTGDAGMITLPADGPYIVSAPPRFADAEVFFTCGDPETAFLQPASGYQCFYNCAIPILETLEVTRNSVPGTLTWDGVSLWTGIVDGHDVYLDPNTGEAFDDTWGYGPPDVVTCDPFSAEYDLGGVIIVITE